MRTVEKEDFLTLARQAFQRTGNASPKCDSHATTEKGHAKTDEKTDARERGEKVVYGLSLVEVEREAGAVDWEANKDAPHWAEAYGRSVNEGRLVRAGITPDTYTKTIHCRICGDVPAPPDWPSTVNNCRWCSKAGDIRD